MERTYGAFTSITTLLSEMKKKGIRTHQLNGIIFAGGGMQMPFLQQILLDHFEGIDRVNGNTSIFRTVALGAALYNQNIEEKSVPSIPVASGTENNASTRKSQVPENLFANTFTNKEGLLNSSQIESVRDELLDSNNEGNRLQTHKEYDDNTLEINRNANAP